MQCYTIYNNIYTHIYYVLKTALSASTPDSLAHDVWIGHVDGVVDVELRVADEEGV